MRSDTPMHGTTILAVRHGGSCALAGDGQVTLGQTVVKHKAKKIQRLHGNKVLAGFAGSTADAMAQDIRRTSPNGVPLSVDPDRYDPTTPLGRQALGALRARYFPT